MNRHWPRRGQAHSDTRGNISPYFRGGNGGSLIGTHIRPLELAISAVLLTAQELNDIHVGDFVKVAAPVSSPVEPEIVVAEPFWLRVSEVPAPGLSKRNRWLQCPQTREYYQCRVVDSSWRKITVSG